MTTIPRRQQGKAASDDPKSSTEIRSEDCGSHSACRVFGDGCVDRLGLAEHVGLQTCAEVRPVGGRLDGDIFGEWKRKQISISASTELGLIVLQGGQHELVAGFSIGQRGLMV